MTRTTAAARRITVSPGAIKILLRPIQAEHIRDAYLKPENKARGSLTFPEDFFSPYHLDLVYEIITKEERSSNIEFIGTNYAI